MLGAALCLAGLFIALRFSSPSGEWERHNRAALLALKSEAEALAISGQLPEAHRRYGQLQDLVAGHDLKDPSLQAAIQKAMVDRDRLFDILLQARQRESLAQRPLALTAPGTQPPTPADAASQPPSCPRHPHLRPPRRSHPRTPAALPAAIAPATRPATVPATRVSPSASTSAPAARNPAPLDRPEHGDIPRPAPIAGAPGMDAQLARTRPPPATRKSAAPSSAAPITCSGASSTENCSTTSDRAESYQQGLDALCVYALLQCGQAIADPRLNIRGPVMTAMVERMKAFPMEQGKATYSRALRATALALYDRPDDRKRTQGRRPLADPVLHQWSVHLRPTSQHLARRRLG